MKTVYQRSTLSASLQQAYATPDNVQACLSDTAMPGPVVEWLADLALLHGVPFNYLVPDEAMLPPESLRFFYLDNNWIDALIDGAMSIGRNLTQQAITPETMLHAATLPDVNLQIEGSKRQKRPRAFGVHGSLSGFEEGDAKLISGFVLRSSLVADYPDMNVKVYREGHTPDTDNPSLLPILRWERLGPESDVLVCLVAGDAFRVDLHEAPQALHYGVDYFKPADPSDGSSLRALKKLYTFGVTGAAGDTAVTMSKTSVETDISTCFRKNSRVLGMDALAQLILQANKKATPPPGTSTPVSIDSAAMGFEMTEGVGMVSFLKSKN